MVIWLLLQSLCLAGKLAFTTQPSSVTSKQILVGNILDNVVVQVQTDTGSTDTSASEKVMIIIDGGTLTGTVYKSPSSGVVTFTDLKPLATGSQQLVAFTSSLDPVISQSFSVYRQDEPFRMQLTGVSALTLDQTYAFTVEFIDSVGNTYPFSGTVSLSVVESQASVTGDTTAQATDGMASFSSGVDKLGTFHLYPEVSGYSMEANALEVTVSNPTKPTYMEIEVDTTLSMSKVFEVKVLYYSGNGEVNTYSDDVTIQLSSGTLQGTLTQTSSGGQATFSDVYLPYGQSAGSNTLQASCASCGVATQSVSVTFVNDSQVILELSQQPTVYETDGTFDYSIYLSQAPITANVVISLASSDTSLITTPSSLTFTTANYDTAQTVSLTLVDTGGSIDGRYSEVTITHSVTGDDQYQNHHTLIGCDQVSGVDLTVTVLNAYYTAEYLAIQGDFAVEENQSSTYNVYLSFSPSGTVTVTPSSSSLTITSGVLTFNSGNYNTPQAVTYQGAPGLLGNQQFGYFEIQHTITGGDQVKGLLAPPATILVVSSSSFSSLIQSTFPVLKQSSSTTYTIVLESAPTDNVVVSMTSSDTSLTVTNSLTFTTGNWNTPQTVDLSHTPDGTAHQMVFSFIISHSVSSNDKNYDNSQNFSLGKDLQVLMLNPCDYGTLYDNSSGSCDLCPDGSSCPSPLISESCTSGYYSPQGTFVCLPCPPGSFCPDGTTITACSSGQYSLGYASSCQTCPLGFYCPSQTSPPAECPQGTRTSSTGAITCTTLAGAEVGFPQGSATTCLAGTFISSMRSYCEACPPGHYCDDASDRTNIIPCGAGTFAASGKTGSCDTCPAGHACSLFEDLGVCPEGYYSEVGWGSCVICPGGSFCTGGAKTDCTNGSFRLGLSACEACPVGAYCLPGLPPMHCPPGYVSDSDGTCARCADGKYQDKNICEPCPAGYFCPNPVSPPIPCYFGTYSSTESTSCTACDEGYTCGQGSSSATELGCPDGYQCLQTTLSSGQKVTWPKPCPAGFYGTGGSCSNSCTAGYYCLRGQSSGTQNPCPMGHYCDTGASVPVPCSAGQYNPVIASTSSTACLACTAGYYCLQGAPHQLVCPPGHYCGGGSGSASACDAGTFYYGTKATTSGDCITCPAGHYCPEGSFVPTPCPAGKFSSNTGNQMEDDCDECTAGSYCHIPGLTAPILECFEGYYCLAGSIVPTTKCPAGKISDSFGVTSSVGCSTDCPAGWACPEGTSNARQPKIPCDEGHYCAARTQSSDQMECNAGTYGYLDYLTNADDCATCPAGYYCVSGTVVPTICPTGHYCPPGTTSNSQYPCPAGYYNPVQGLEHQGQCIICPKGYQCSSGSTHPTACTAGNYNDQLGGSCVSCNEGYYCPYNVNKQQLPCGKGYSSTSGTSSCKDCDAGHYCPNQATTTNNQQNANLCPAGLYCPQNTDHVPTNLYDRCSKGHYCQEQTQNQTDCQEGTLRRIEGAAAPSDCIDVESGYYVSGTGNFEPTGECDPGYYCPAKSTSATQSKCSGGTLRTIGAATSSDDCGACPAGFYCSAGASQAIICPVGHYCPEGTQTPIDCPAGTHNPGTGMLQQSDCAECPPGEYCATDGLENPTGECQAGYFCGGRCTTNQGGTKSDGSPVVCPAGGYCPQGTAVKIPCPVGKYMPSTGNSDQTDCVTCPAGQYCAGASNESSGDCEAGFYCTGGASTKTQNIAQAGYYTGQGAESQIPCAAGTYNPAQGQKQCLSCPAGFYCPGTGNTEPTVCTPGNYCQQGSDSVTPCDPGYFNPFQGMSSSGDCIPCTHGHACPNSGMTAVGDKCQAGWWCYEGAPATSGLTTTDNYAECDAGHYCPQGSGAPTPCPPGTYRSATGGTQESDCTNCDPGYYCQGLGNTDTTGQCLEGYFCDTTAEIRNPINGICTPGNFCQTGAQALTPCPAGQYQPDYGQNSCLACPAGFMCEQGASNFNTVCPAGYYCQQGTKDATKTPCVAGTYNPLTAASDSSFCKTCDPGKYCSGTGQSSTTGECTAGYYCTGGSTTATPSNGSGEGGECAAGEYCPTGSSAPKVCDAGSYCDSPNLGAVSGQCSAGYYCLTNSSQQQPSTNDSKGGRCQAGYYCEAGSVAPTPCPAGTFNSNAGSQSHTDCVACPAGQYCDSIALNAPRGNCNAGWYCQGSEISSTPANKGCAAGYKCAEGSSAPVACTNGEYQSAPLQGVCLTCPKGFYCNDNPATVNPIRCPAGYYCPLGTSDYTVNACQLGQYNPLLGQIDETACLDCPPGQYCATTGLSEPTDYCDQGYFCGSRSSSAQQNQCGSGNYCPTDSATQNTGSTQAIPCPPGKYCNSATLGAPEGDCNLGYVCYGGATNINQNDGTLGEVCAKGHYCPLGSSYMIPCPIGTYNDQTQQTEEADCTPCDAGSYCDKEAAIAVSGVCAAGFYCPEGSKMAKPPDTMCPIGFKCPEGSSTYEICQAGQYAPYEGLDDCLPCPAGYMCEASVLPSTYQDPVLCTAGYKCPEGSSDATKVICPEHTWNNYQGQTDCFPCPIGFFCDEGTTVPEICTGGNYCAQGTGQVPCPDGTYSTIAGLQREDNCKPCPAGSYCTGGTITGDCLAGYYCVSKNKVENPDGTDADPNVVGGLCPIGHYCQLKTVMPIPCQEGKTSVAGSDEESDCTACPAGFYCIPGDVNPYDCPWGSYCPEGSQVPQDCPIYTYQPNLNAQSIQECITCPAGYLCDDTGIGELTRFPCDAGHYCEEGATESTPCPAGTYGPSHDLKSAEDCTDCPSGFYCLEGATTYIACGDWRWCPEGSSEQGDCPAGSYCAHNQKTLVDCPAGYYCPTTDTGVELSPPYECVQGEYCQAGSGSPTDCPAGTTYVVYSQRASLTQACIYCPAGTYANKETNTCDQCNAGYICNKGASSPTPQSDETEGGHPCTPGFYCPAGTIFEYACPPGTYRPDTQDPENEAASQDDCLPCKVNLYNNLEGQAGCYPCGKSSTATTGQTNCSCRGENRAFQKREGTCLCQPFFQFFIGGVEQSEEDSDQDCVPIPLPICLEGEIRTERGLCVTQDSNGCQDQCQGRSGTRDKNKGFCYCEDQYVVDDVCDSDCQSRLKEVILQDDGIMLVVDPVHGTQEEYDFQSTEGYMGNINCYDQYSCVCRSVVLNGGVFQTDLEPGAMAGQFRDRRRLQDTPSLVNPVYCLEIGETMIFEIDYPDHYPIYQKESLLNTNSEFDYGPFVELEELIEDSGQVITNFGYTFQEAGTYVFSDKTDDDNMLIVTVKDEFESCSTPFVRERASYVLSSNGSASDDDYTLDTDWRVYMFIITIIIIFLVVITLIQVFRNQTKKRLQRKQQELANKGPLTGQKAKIQVEEMIVADTPLSNKKKAAVLDPQIFQAIYDRLMDLNKVLKEKLAKQESNENEEVGRILNELKMLKDVILNCVNPEYAPRNELVVGGDQEMNPENLHIVQNIDIKKELQTNKFVNKINSSELNQHQKEDLLGELNENLANLESQLAESKVQSQNNLKDRIEQRNRRRRELMRKRAQLDEQERELKEEMQREVKQADNITQQAQKEYEKQKRRIREKEFGQSAKAARKRLLDRTVANPEKQQEYLEMYQQEMRDLEQKMDGQRGRKHHELLDKLEKRRQERRQRAQLKAQKAQDAHSDVSNQLRLVEQKIDMFRELEIPVVVVPEAEEADLTQQESKNINKKYNELQAATQVKFSTEQNQLQKQRQQLSNALSQAGSSDERDRILEQLKMVEDQMQGAFNARQAQQKQNLADRLRERRRLRKERQQRNDGAAKQKAAKEKAKQEQAASENRINKLEEFIRSLPEQDRLTSIKELLADKHDQELIQLQAAQQQRATAIHASQLKETLDNKIEAMNGAQVHLRDMTENQQSQALTGMLLDAQHEAQKDFQQKWDQHQKKCNAQLMNLLDKQMQEVNDLMKKLGMEEKLGGETKAMNDEFRARKTAMEKEAAERMEALEKQREDLSKLAREKKEELELEMAEAQRKAELERAKRELENRQKKERDELARKGELTKQQMEQLIAQHQRELAQLEGSISDEKERQKNILKKKLEEKRERRRKALQVPDDMKQFTVNTAQKLKVFREAEHIVAEVDEDILSELLRRVMRVEGILASADTSQFKVVMDAIDHLNFQISKVGRGSKQ